MSFALVTGQFNRANTSGLTIAASLPSTPIPGNLVIATIQFFDGTSASLPSVSILDGNSNAFTRTASVGGAPNLGGAVFVAYILAAPSNINKTITVTFGSAAGNSTLWLREFSNAGNCTYESDTTGTGSGTAINTPTYTPGGSNRLLITHGTPDHSISSANGVWTCPESLPFAGGGDCSAYDLSASTATAENLTANVSGNWWTIIAGFYEASGAVDALEWKPRSQQVALAHNYAPIIIPVN